MVLADFGVARALDSASAFTIATHFRRSNAARSRSTQSALCPRVVTERPEVILAAMDDLDVATTIATRPMV